MRNHKKYVNQVSAELSCYNDNNDYDSIIKLRKRYRKRGYLTTIIISIYLLIIIIPVGLFLRKSFDSSFNIAVAITTVGLILNGFVVSSRSWVKRYNQDGQNPNTLNNGKFVLYLRAFNDDDTPWSSEESIVKAFKGKLPVYKIGKPNDIELGESDVIKFYETDLSWKEQISKAKEKSKYIVLSLNGTDGLIWEYLDTIKFRQKILYIIEKKESYTQFCIRYRKYTNHSFDSSISLQKDYPCYIWFNNDNIVIISTKTGLSVNDIIKRFIKDKKQYNEGN